ncbi:hypothetical protein B0H66DRAFT_624820 [Apodospora peruviana]|uniref:Uncharacterized protein n=1 Tax=Apodospora peruviana TaxID=516989 RepID=A0AAE0HZX8_9PEZI|nr:hypothetical protein B0H66DRAFT_624820 [Apodospora peruviana]
MDMSTSFDYDSMSTNRSYSRTEIDSVKTTILLLERLDDILIDMAREAIPQNLETTREGYQQSRFGDAEVRQYLASLPGSAATWVNLNRSILRHLAESRGSRREEWELWLSGAESAGTATWQEAINARPIYFSTTPGGAAAINGLIERLRFTDGLLNPIHSSLFGQDAEKRTQFSSELEDTLQVSTIRERMMGHY